MKEFRTSCGVTFLFDDIVDDTILVTTRTFPTLGDIKEFADWLIEEQGKPCRPFIVEVGG